MHSTIVRGSACSLRHGAERLSCCIYQCLDLLLLLLLELKLLCLLWLLWLLRIPQMFMLQLLMPIWWL